MERGSDDGIWYNCRNDYYVETLNLNTPFFLIPVISRVQLWREVSFPVFGTIVVLCAPKPIRKKVSAQKVVEVSSSLQYDQRVLQRSKSELPIATYNIVSSDWPYNPHSSYSKKIPKRSNPTGVPVRAKAKTHARFFHHCCPDRTCAAAGVRLGCSSNGGPPGALSIDIDMQYWSSASSYHTACVSVDEKTERFWSYKGEVEGEFGTKRV